MRRIGRLRAIMESRDKPRENASSPTTSARAAERASRRRRERDGDEHFFEVEWPLPASACYPTLARRAAALGIDFLIGLPMVPIAFIASDGFSGFSLDKYDCAVRSIVMIMPLYATYFALWESSQTRASPGKIMLDLCVARPGDKPLSFADSFIRCFASLVSLVTLNAGAWLSWRDPRGQALHDRLFDTVVVASHVTPGKLRTTVRAPMRNDFVWAAVSSAIAYAFVFQLLPGLVSELRLSDRFDAATIEIDAMLAAGAPLGEQRDWSPAMRDASEKAAALGLRIDVDASGPTIVVSALEASTGGDGWSAAERPSLRFERSVGPANAGWTCALHGFAWYASPRQCRQGDPASQGEHPRESVAVASRAG